MKSEALAVGIVGALCVLSMAAIEIVALCNGINGTLMAGTMAGIGAVVGVVGTYIIRIIREMKNAKTSRKPDVSDVP